MTRRRAHGERRRRRRAVVPTTFDQRRRAPPGMVRPVASVIANCMRVKHEPLVIDVEMTAVVVHRRLPASETALGNGVETV